MILDSVDFSPLVMPLVLLFVLAIIISIAKSAWFKGVLGEFIVNSLIQLLLDKHTYHLIKDVTLPTEDGGTTQIDHIIVSPYGVFVVETKNMKGWIFGGQHQKTWTQKIYKKTFKFQNPIHQNYKHLKTLQSLLELEDEHMHSVTVFIGDSTFKTDMPPNVTHGIGYVRYIKSKTEQVLSEWEVRQVTGLIESGRLERSSKTSREHIEYLKSNKQRANPVQTSPLCPKCGSDMVLRTAKRGANAGNQFWGCERYPQCKGTTHK